MGQDARRCGLVVFRNTRRKIWFSWQETTSSDVSQPGLICVPAPRKHSKRKSSRLRDGTFLMATYLKKFTGFVYFLFKPAQTVLVLVITHLGPRCGPVFVQNTKVRQET